MFEILVKYTLHIGETQRCYFDKRDKTNKGDVYTMQIWQRAYLYEKKKTSQMKSCQKWVKEGESMPIIEIENLRYAYGKHTVLRGISAQLEQGKMYAIFGPLRVS